MAKKGEALTARQRYWLDCIEECERGGQTLKAYAEERDISVSTLYSWKKQLKRKAVVAARRQYACGSGQCLKTAPLPPQPIPKSVTSPGLLAHIAVSKNQDALPLYRQQQILERIGVELPRASLANWMIRMGTLIQPLTNLLREQLLSYDIVQMDETTVQVLKEPGKPAQSKSYLWVQRGGPRLSPSCCSTTTRRAAARCRSVCCRDFRGICRATVTKAITRWCAASVTSPRSVVWPMRPSRTGFIRHRQRIQESRSCINTPVRHIITSSPSGRDSHDGGWSLSFVFSWRCTRPSPVIEQNIQRRDHEQHQDGGAQQPEHHRDHQRLDRRRLGAGLGQQRKQPGDGSGRGDQNGT